MSGAFDADFWLYLQLSAPLFTSLSSPLVRPCGLTSLPGDKAKEAFVSSAGEFHVFHDTPKTMVDGVSKIGKFEIVARVASKGYIGCRRRGTVE